jgi:hypothetical protein
MVVSSEQLRSRERSGENDTELTVPAWPYSDLEVSPDLSSIILAFKDV